MTADELLTAAIEDARKTYAHFETMATEELIRLQMAHAVDLGHAQTPEGIAFGGGRLALIAAVLQRRGEVGTPPPSIVCPRCHARSYHPRDIAEKYCGACQSFHDATLDGSSR
jgi:hypothetical protein